MLCSLKCIILLLGHHSMFRNGNCMYYMNLLPPNLWSSLLLPRQSVFPLWKNGIISIYYRFRLSSWIGAKQQYYYDEDRLLQFQTDFHFNYVTELTKYSHQIVPLVDVGHVTAPLENNSLVVFSAANYLICRRISKWTLLTQFFFVLHSVTSFTSSHLYWSTNTKSLLSACPNAVDRVS